MFDYRRKTWLAPELWRKNDGPCNALSGRFDVFPSILGHLNEVESIKQLFFNWALAKPHFVETPHRPHARIDALTRSPGFPGAAQRKRNGSDNRQNDKSHLISVSRERLRKRKIARRLAKREIRKNFRHGRK